MPPADPFTVLFVCTGNICRSPIAEQVFRARFGSEHTVFASAGTDAVVGAGMPDEARAVSEALGADPAGHTSRQLTPAILERADLVIAMSRRHRGVIARMAPRASRITFTLREAARLSASVLETPGVRGEGDSVPQRLRSAVTLLAAQRGYLDPLDDPADDDVPDPYRRGEAAFRLAGELIDDSADRVVAALAALS